MAINLEASDNKVTLPTNWLLFKNANLLMNYFIVQGITRTDCEFENDIRHEIREYHVDNYNKTFKQVNGMKLAFVIRMTMMVMGTIPRVATFTLLWTCIHQQTLVNLVMLPQNKFLLAKADIGNRFQLGKDTRELVDFMENGVHPESQQMKDFVAMEFHQFKSKYKGSILFDSFQMNNYTDLYKYLAKKKYEV